MDNYGEQEGHTLLCDILDNVGPHLESSGSGPLKKVRSGEVGIAFGLRHQALADKEKGLPIDCIDPIEGNYTLTESIAVVKKEHVNKCNGDGSLYDGKRKKGYSVYLSNSSVRGRTGGGSVCQQISEGI